MDVSNCSGVSTINVFSVLNSIVMEIVSGDFHFTSQRPPQVTPQSQGLLTSPLVRRYGIRMCMCLISSTHWHLVVFLYTL